MSHTSKHINANILLYTVGDLLALGVSSFLLIPIYLRHMTPSEYGIFGIVTTTTMLLGVVTCMGAHSSVSRFYYIYKERGEEIAYLGSIWLAQTVISSAISVILVVLRESLWVRLSPEVPCKPYFWLVVIGAFLSFSSGIYPVWLRVQEKASEFVIFQVINTGLLVTFVWLFLIRMKASALGAICAILGANIGMALISAFRLRHCFTKWHFRFSYIKESAIFGTSIVLGTFGYYFLSRSQIYVLQQYSSLSAIGIFNLALQLGSILTIVSNSFAKAWQPILYSSRTKEIAGRSIANIAKYFIATMLYMTVAIIIMSQEILQILARPAYYETRYVMCLITLASFFYVSALLSASVLLYAKQAGSVLITIWVTAGINLTLSLIVVPKLRTIGSAYSILISFIIYSIMIYLQAQRVLKVSYDWGNIARILFGGILVVALGWLFSLIFSDRILISARIVTIASYPFLLLVLGAFKKEEFIAIYASLFREVRAFCLSLHRIYW